MRLARPLLHVVALLRRAHARTNHLHWAVLAVFFLNGFLEAFPLTAFGQWLKDDIGMGPATQSTFYASVFVPWSLKPLYGWLSEAVPIAGRRRQPYVVAASLLSAATYAVAALAVRNVAGAFAVTLARTTANACAELMLGLLLVDCAARNMANAGAVQAAATAVRALSSVAAFLVGLPMYPCRGGGSGGAGLSPRRVIGINAVFPLVAAVVALALPDPRVKRRPLRGRVTSRGGGGGRPWGRATAGVEGDDIMTTTTINATPRPDGQPDKATAGHVVLATTDSDSSAECGALVSVPVPVPVSPRPTFPVNALLMPAVLLLLCWAAVHDLMEQRTWLLMMAGVLVVDAGVAGVLVRHALRSRPHDGWGAALRRLGALWPAVVLFLLNATPSSSTQVSEGEARSDSRDFVV